MQLTTQQALECLFHIYRHAKPKPTVLLLIPEVRKAFDDEMWLIPYGLSVEEHSPRLLVKRIKQLTVIQGKTVAAVAGTLGPIDGPPSAETKLDAFCGVFTPREGGPQIAWAGIGNPPKLDGARYDSV